MKETYQYHLDESIRLELNLARLYTLFHDASEEDEEFWWQLAMEERGHAALLQQEKKQPQPETFFPGNLLAKDLAALEAANRRINALIESFQQQPLPRADRFRTALELELSAGESHYQEFLDSPTESAAASIFKQLNQEDRDHAKRIREYMDAEGLGN
ncbi:rubrerythrin family protein [Chlorobium sp. N1]|uniref:rubrerythrin family protein n=1 Tax=Chlorobium sp. N1 TaxID=2491138 RepID=UPI0010395403|nr:rubrerythrin family protein [Chlorobium sp. N1]TCD48722.1 rubrerythrin family protein [Chlorobium sp. N1]